VFEAIDMPLDMQSQDIARVLEKYIERYVTCRDIVLMVDMGSLEQIHREVRGLTGVNIGIINNISTALAVDIGIGISANRSMEEILKGASENNTCTYQIISNEPKEEAVIFSGENGIGTAEKIKELILASSEACIPVRFIAYDYYRDSVHRPGGYYLHEGHGAVKLDILRLSGPGADGSIQPEYAEKFYPSEFGGIYYYFESRQAA